MAVPTQSKPAAPNPTSKGKAKAAKAARLSTGHPEPGAKTTKLDQIIDQLWQPEGASIAELMALTGWQAHSVRGALAGSLKRKGHIITSSKTDGVRRYRIEAGR